MAAERNNLEYEHTPYSFINGPELSYVHQIVVDNCGRLGVVDQAKWMSSITDRPVKRKRHNPYRDYFIDFPYTGPVNQIPYPGDRRNLNATIALRTYTTARIESIKRIYETTEPFGGDRGLGVLLYRETTRLSNGIRMRYILDNPDPEELLLAHDIVMYGGRFNQADELGYSQTIGHWLHGYCGRRKDRCYYDEAKERRMRLCLALSELAIGPQETYAHMVARDLVELLIAKGDNNEADKIKKYFAGLPNIKDEPGRWLEGRNRLERMKSKKKS